MLIYLCLLERNLPNNKLERFLEYLEVLFTINQDLHTHLVLLNSCKLVYVRREERQLLNICFKKYKHCYYDYRENL